MNEEQHDALNRRDRARAHVLLKHHEWVVAGRNLNQAQNELNTTIAADLTSWTADDRRTASQGNANDRA